MGDTVKNQISELAEKRRQTLEKVRALSEAIRAKAGEIDKLRGSHGVRNFESRGMLNKRIEELEFRISSENLPLDLERELAKQIALLERRKKKLAEIEGGGSEIGTLNSEIKALKNERERLKAELDADAKEVETLAGRDKPERPEEEDAAGEFLLGDVVTVRQDAPKREEAAGDRAGQSAD